MKGTDVTELIEENGAEDFTIRFTAPDGRTYVLDSLSINPDGKTLSFRGEEVTVYQIGDVVAARRGHKAIYHEVNHVFKDGRLAITNAHTQTNVNPEDVTLLCRASDRLDTTKLPVVRYFR